MVTLPLLKKSVTITALVCSTLLIGCNSGEGSWPSDLNSESDSSSEDTEASYSSEDTSGGVLVASGDFALETLQSVNTSGTSGTIRQLQLNWESAVDDGSDVIYTLCQVDESEHDRCNVLDTQVNTLSATLSLDSLLQATDRSYFVIAETSDSTLISSEKKIHPGEFGKLAGYFKASNTGKSDSFGHKVAISGDGFTIVATAPMEDSAATGINGNETDDTYASTSSGAAYVYQYDSATATWSQTAYLKTEYPERLDFFGYALDISEDGSTIAIGAYGEDSSDGDNPADNSSSYAGAVYVFSNNGSSWVQSAYVKPDEPTAAARFGYSLALNETGTRLAVGAPYQNSDSGLKLTGAAFIFAYDGESWSQQAKLTASNPSASDYWGIRLSMSDDGQTVAVAAYQEDSAATGVNGDETNNDAASSGSVHVFKYTNNAWQQSAYLKASNTNADDFFGYSLALNRDGSLLAVGAIYESSIATSINGDQSNNDAPGAGAVYVFEYADGSWLQQAYIKSANSDGASYGYMSDSALDPTSNYFGDHFGSDVKFNATGTILAVSAKDEDSISSGINWDAEDNSLENSGAVYVFSFDDANSVWSQTAYVKASNPQSSYFGTSIDLTSEGDVLVAGATSEISGATGINGDQADDSEKYSGAVYVY